MLALRLLFALTAALVSVATVRWLVFVDPPTAWWVLGWHVTQFMFVVGVVMASYDHAERER